MTTDIKEILNTFDLSPDNDKKDLASEILRRTVHFDFPPLTDEELIQSAEKLFLDLDRRESKMPNPQRGVLNPSQISSVENSVRLWLGL